jgi:hypothetical protein
VCVVTGAQQPVGQAIIQELAGMWIFPASGDVADVLGRESLGYRSTGVNWCLRRGNERIGSFG